MRYRVLAALFAFFLFVRAVPTYAQVQIEASYSEAANVFSLMDNVTAWAGRTDPAYREEWSQRFGWSVTDQRWADRYARYRHRTVSAARQDLPPSASADGLFAPALSNMSDPLARHFLQQRSIATVLGTLGQAASPLDAKMLAGFYRHFEPKWRRILGESSPLAAQASLLNAQLHRPGAATFVTRLSRFYRVELAGTFQIFFVWYPPGTNSNAEVVAGKNFVIHQPAANTDSDWDTIAMHELVHYVSGQQSRQQKQALTRRFLARCPAADRANALLLLEEPLAVAWGQGAYSKYGRGKPLDWDQNWYASPLIDLLGHLLWPSVDRIYGTDAVITDGLIDAAAKDCAEFFAAEASGNAPR